MKGGSAMLENYHINLEEKIENVKAIKKTVIIWSA